MSISKARYVMRVSYDDEFKTEVDDFIKLIYLDKEIDKLAKNNSQRISAAVRWLIKKYNTQRGPKVIEEAKIKNEK